MTTIIIMDTLSLLFGNQARIKVIRLFMFNPGTALFPSEIGERSKLLPGLVKKELSILLKADIIRTRNTSKEIQITKGKKVSIKKLKGTGYYLNEKFPYLEPLKNLLTVASIQADESLAKSFASAGKVKLLMAAGVFIQNWESRVDLLIVGDELNINKIETTIKNIEAEIGKEIAYSAFDTEDFEYRLGIHDRLIRDILDYPHVTLIDRLNIML